jgi:cytidylate kinase
LAKDLAKHFGLTYIDTGAMYRAVTLYAIEKGLIIDSIIDEKLLESDLNNGKIKIEFKYNPTIYQSETYLNQVNVESKIRSIEVSNFVSPIAVLPFVRSALVDQQRDMGKEGNVVMDGRDIGTHVFPNAHLKLFLTASDEIRAKRRYNELILKGDNVNYEDVIKNVRERDKIDSTRKTNPLKKAEDAILIDNSNISIVEQTQIGIKLINDVLKKL